jgi:NADH dehydrogenase/NADH:ubiquinone oxidoreductase subunit G
MITVRIDGRTVEVPKGSAIVDAAKKAGITIPTLCYFDLQNKMTGLNSSCRVCVVEVAGRKNLAAACSTPVMEGMEILTQPAVIAARKMMLELLLSDHRGIV